MQGKRIFVLTAAALSACGGSTPITDTGYTDSCSPGGIWRAAGGSVAIIDESPRVHLVQSDGTQFVGDVTGYTINNRECYFDRDKSELHAVLPLGASLPDGSHSGTGKADASWVKRSGQLQLTADIKTSASGKFTLAFIGAYDPLHGSGSSRAAIAGSYRPTSSPAAEVLTIDAAGQMFSQNATTGCVINGTIDPVDGRFDVYRVNLTYSACQGALSPLNGLPVKGLATYDAGKTPAELFMALDAASSLQHYSIVLTERRT